MRKGKGGQREMAENGISKSIGTNDIEPYSPLNVNKKIDDMAAMKACLSFPQAFVLAILAGIYTGFGAQFATLVTSDSVLNFGFTSFLMGLLFCMGIMSCAIAGAELFTSNVLVIMGYTSMRIPTSGLMYNWGVSYFGNFAGCIFMVGLMYMAHEYEFFQHRAGANALLIAHKKTDLSSTVAFSRAIMCNSMVCIGVWCSYSGKSVADKIATLVLPIAGFVASGWEHCIANMYFIPMGLILKSVPEVVSRAEKVYMHTYGHKLDISTLTWKTFFVDNLIPVTLGNIFGGIIIGLALWFVYQRPKSSIFS